MEKIKDFFTKHKIMFQFIGILLLLITVSIEISYIYQNSNKNDNENQKENNNNQEEDNNDKEAELPKDGWFNDITKTFNSLFIVSYDGTHSLMNMNGKIIIDLPFAEVEQFYNGVAKVVKNNKFGYIDESGKVIIPIEYDNDEMKDKNATYICSENLYIVSKNNKLGCVDKSGKIVIPIEYTKLATYNFRHNLTVAELDDKKGIYKDDGTLLLDVSYKNISPEYENEKLINFITDENALYNTSGVKVSKDNYDKIEYLGSYRYLATKGSQKYLIKSDGSIIKTLNYDDFLRYDEYNTPLAEFINNVTGVSKNKKWGLINVDGNEITPFIYDGIKVTEKYIMVQSNQKWGIINNNYQLTVPTIYDELNYTIFGEGKTKYLIATQNNKYGLIDSNNNVLIPCLYDDLEHENDSSTLYSYKLNSKYGLITDTNQKLTEAIYDAYHCGTENEECFAFEFFGNDKYSIVKINNKYGVIDNTGKIIIGYQDKELSIVSNYNKNQYVIVKDNDKYGIWDITGREISPIEYKSAWLFGNNLFNVQTIEDKFMVIDSNSNIIVPADNYNNLYFATCANDACDRLLVTKDGYQAIFKNGNIIKPYK